MLQVDKIITISLRDNHERQLSTNRELEKLQLKTEFYLADRHVGHEEHGCFTSHQQACLSGLQDPNCQSLLVFEDDVKVLPYTAQQIEQINKFLRSNTDFDILYLGLIVGKMWFSKFKHIVRATGSGAHAYILSKRGMQKLSGYQYNGKPVDKVFKHDFKCYSVYPMIAEQYPEEVLKSDISNSRSASPVKDKQFWLDNNAKQKNEVWKNLHKTALDIILFR